MEERAERINGWATREREGEESRTRERRWLRQRTACERKGTKRLVKAVERWRERNSFHTAQWMRVSLDGSEGERSTRMGLWDEDEEDEEEEEEREDLSFEFFEEEDEEEEEVEEDV